MLYAGENYNKRGIIGRNIAPELGSGQERIRRA